MRRLAHNDREKGVIAPITAFLLVGVLGMAAFAVDVGMVYAERAQLQNGADSAAMAIAEICSKSTAAPGCVSPQSYANTMADGNANDAHSKAFTPVVDLTAGTVDVTTQAQTAAGENHFSLVFARALGIEVADVRASAQANWFYPTRGTAFMPLAFSPCQFNSVTVAQKLLVQGNQTCAARNPSGQESPGGFAWLEADSSDPCNVTAEVGKWSHISTGGNTCGALSAFIGKTVALPVYAYDCGGMPQSAPLWWGNCTGNNTYYMIEKWAGFKVLGFRFGGGGNEGGDTSQFTGSEKGLYGQFVGFSADPSAFTGGSTTPTGNVKVVGLSK